MKASSSWIVGFIFLIFAVQEGCSLSGFVGFSVVLLAIITGFLLGNFTLTTLLILLMAVTPPEIHSTHRRGIRSAAEAHSVASSMEGKNESSSQARRLDMDGRFLQNLISSDPLNCLPSLLCSAASSPSAKEDILNDYQYLMKEVLQLADENTDGQEKSGYHNIYSKLNAQHIDNEDDIEDDDKDSDEKSDEEIDKIYDLMAMKENAELEEKMYSELVEDDPADLGFVMAEMKNKDKWRQRRPSTKRPHLVLNENLMKAITDPDLKMLFDRFRERVSRNMDELTEKLESSPENLARNPRMEKIVFFSNKQRELRQAKSVDDRLRIASEVGTKYRSARQCRRLFNTCPFQPNTLSRLVNNLRRVLSGMPTNNKQQTASLTNNGKGSNSIVSASTEPGTNVQVVVNLGSGFGGGAVNQAEPVTAAPYQSAPATGYQKPLPQVHIPISLPHTFPGNVVNPSQTPLPPTTATPSHSINYQNYFNHLNSPLSNMHSTLTQPTSKPTARPFVSQLHRFTTRIPTTTTFATTAATTTKFTTWTNPSHSINSTKPSFSKPSFDSFFDFLNNAPTNKASTSETKVPEAINKLFKRPLSKLKPNSTESGGLGSPHSQPSLQQSSTTTEKGYLLPVGFDVDAGTRTIPSTSTSNEFITTTFSQNDDDTTFTPLEYIFTHPNEGAGAEYIFQRQPEATEPPKSPESVTQSQRQAAEAFLAKIMNSEKHVQLQSSTIITAPPTTAKPNNIFNQNINQNNKPNKIWAKPSEMAINDYLSQLEETLENEKYENKTSIKKAVSLIPTATEAEQKESEELLAFIRNIHQEKKQSSINKPPHYHHHIIPHSDPFEDDHEMKEIDEVIKLLDEELRDDEEDDDDDEDVIKKAVTKNENKKATKVKIPHVFTPFRSTTTKMTTSTTTTTSTSTTTRKTTTTTPRPTGIMKEIDEVISLLDNAEKKSKPLLPRRRMNGKRKDLRYNKNKRNKKRKPKPLVDEESSEEEDDDDNLPPSTLGRFRNTRINRNSRPLIAVPYRRSDRVEEEPQPPSRVKAFATGVYSFLFSGTNKPPVQRYLPHYQNTHQNEYSNREQNRFPPQRQFRYQTSPPQFRQEYRAVPHVIDFRRESAPRPNRFLNPYYERFR